MNNKIKIEIIRTAIQKYSEIVEVEVENDGDVEEAKARALSGTYNTLYNSELRSTYLTNVEAFKYDGFTSCEPPSDVFQQQEEYEARVAREADAVLNDVNGAGVRYFDDLLAETE